MGDCGDGRGGIGGFGRAGQDVAGVGSYWLPLRPASRLLGCSLVLQLLPPTCQGPQKVGTLLSSPLSTRKNPTMGTLVADHLGLSMRSMSMPSLTHVPDCPILTQSVGLMNARALPVLFH